MVNYLFEFMASINPLVATDIFILAILLAFIIAVYSTTTGKIKNFSAYTPTLLTTLGILGTFFGITIGLSQFDFQSHETIDASIPHLLGGLKMAFITSILGMGSSILVKIFQSSRKSKADLGPETITSQHFYGLFQEQNKILEAVKKSISGDDDNNVVTQIQKMRTEIQDTLKVMQGEVVQNLDKVRQSISGDGQDSILKALKSLQQSSTENNEKIRAEFKIFGEKLSEMATKHIIEALNKVIKDFNKNLTEQFGDNFKQLNSAVGQLVLWQEEYKQQMADLKNAMDVSTQAMALTSASIQNIKENTEIIPKHMTKLEAILNTMGLGLSTLEKDLSAFDEIRDRAVQALPTIAQNVQVITSMVKDTVEQGTALHTKFVSQTTDMVNWVTIALKNTAQNIDEKNKELVDMLGKSTEETALSMRNTFQELETLGHKLRDEGSKAVERITQDIRQASEKSQENISDIYTDLGQKSEKLFNNINAEIQTLLTALREDTRKAEAERAEMITKQINEQIRALDAALQEELTRAMQIMANHLATITNKFVEDYQFYTKALPQQQRQVE